MEKENKMNGHQKFWAIIWITIATSFLGIVFCLSVMSMHADYRISQAIKSGVNPVKAKYALRITDAREDSLAWMTTTNENKK